MPFLSTFLDIEVTWKAFDDFNRNKKVYEVMFFYIKVYILWNFIQYTIHWDKTQISKNFPSGKINCTKNIPFFLLRAPAHHSFIFNRRFLNELKHKVHVSKNVRGIFNFRFRFVFINVYIFVQQKVWTLWL